MWWLSHGNISFQRIWKKLLLQDGSIGVNLCLIFWNGDNFKRPDTFQFIWVWVYIAYNTLLLLELGVQFEFVTAFIVESFDGQQKNVKPKLQY